jgi:hypothetical protein
MIIKFITELEDIPNGYESEVFKDVCGTDCFIDIVGDCRHIEPINVNSYVLIKKATNYVCEECSREFTDSYYHDTELEYCPHCGCYEYTEKEGK